MSTDFAAILVCGVLAYAVCKLVERWQARKARIAGCAPHDLVVAETHDFLMPVYVCRRECGFQTPARDVARQRQLARRERLCSRCGGDVDAD